ncbi:MAG: hypothetical protein KDK45_00025 [Leptospiraceae bacterium]|nr:hypothetical protein [Leptospiraceae bacterium]
MEATIKVSIEELDNEFIERLKKFCKKNSLVEIRISSQIEKPDFESWNEQFEGRDLNEYISEYGMTLGEYRKRIYDAEASENSMTKEEFLDKLSNWK